MKWLRWFVAGALAVPLFHQVALWILNAVGWVARQPYSMTPTKPLGVPQVVSLAFWGGLWGIILGLVLLRARPATYWVVAAVFGAIVPTLVAMYVAAPLKGQPAGGNARALLTGLMVNAAWGLGTAVLYRAMNGKRAR
jgi:hypothetical protein